MCYPLSSWMLWCVFQLPTRVVLLDESKKNNFAWMWCGIGHLAQSVPWVCSESAVVLELVSLSTFANGFSPHISTFSHFLCSILSFFFLIITIPMMTIAIIWQKETMIQWAVQPLRRRAAGGRESRRFLTAMKTISSIWTWATTQIGILPPQSGQQNPDWGGGFF